MILTQVATICAWCLKEQGIQPEEDTHGICVKHRNQEREKLRVARAIQPLPIYGTCGHLAKSAQYSCGSPNCSQYSW